MNTEFAASRLSRAAVSLSEANRLFGAQIGRRYIQRLAVIRAADEFDQLYGLRALRLHRLTGDRTGQYAITLTGTFRLVFERLGTGTVRILSVEDYHGD